MYTEVKIESSLVLPYKLIDFQQGDEQFVFAFKCFDEKQTDYSIQHSGVTGSFAIEYRCCGIDSHFELDVTVGNVYEFYESLKNAYNTQLCKDCNAALRNYGSLDRTYILMSFDKIGHCLMKGLFLNGDHQYKSGISFEIEIDQTFIPEILSSLKCFFEELKRIQGHDTFY